MKIDYIVVQAGGRGSRLGHLTRNRPKALVPVDNLPILFHLFRKFPDKRFIIIADYKAEVMKRYLEAFAEPEYVVVDGQGKKGTLGGVRKALTVIPEGVPFLLIWSDLILPPDWELPEERGNYIGLSRDFVCRWSYKGQRMIESSSSDCGIAGLFIFQEKSMLREVPEEGELVRWLSEKNMDFKEISLYHTKEYGLLSEYDRLTGEKKNRCRPFNRIEEKEDKIIKTAVDEQGKMLAVREKAWYQEAIERGLSAIPRIESFDPLVMEKIHGKNLFEYELDDSEQKKVLKKVVDGLQKLHELGSAPADYFSIRQAYLEKTFTRLEKIRDLIPFGDREQIVINGRACRNVFFYRKELEKLFEGWACPKFEFLHGDCTFSNILLNEKGEPIFIDPRGYFGYTELYGDPDYDWAKLYYSIVGNYDQFNQGNFRLNIGEDEVELEIKSNGWEGQEEYFFTLLNGVDRNRIRLIHAVIWLSLTTYAWEDYDSICGAFYNGLLYLEDIFEKYLNDQGKFKLHNLDFGETVRILSNSLRKINHGEYERLLQECEETLRNGHKIVTSGLGKNVPVCDKFTGTMLSMGLNASFLHTNSAVHGDIGMVKAGDLVILLTKSGETEESVYLAELLEKRPGVNLWLLTFQRHSILGERLKALVLDLEHEGDLWNIMPNNSTTLNLIVLQSIAMNLAKKMGLSLEKDFKPNHPGGAIGEKLK